MFTHCAIIRDAYRATLADWEMTSKATWECEIALVQQTAALASVRANHEISEDQVRKVLGAMA